MRCPICGSRNAFTSHHRIYCKNCGDDYEIGRAPKYWSWIGLIVTIVLSIVGIYSVAKGE